MIPMRNGNWEEMSRTVIGHDLIAAGKTPNRRRGVMFSSIFAFPSRRTIALCLRSAKSKSPVRVSVLNALFTFGLVSVRLFPRVPTERYAHLVLAGHQSEGARLREDGKGKDRISTTTVHDGQFGCYFIVVLTRPRYSSFLRRER